MNSWLIDLDALKHAAVKLITKLSANMSRFGSAAFYALLIVGALLLYKKLSVHKLTPPTGDQGRMREVSKALDLYYQDCKTFPSEAQGFAALLAKPENEPFCETWDGPYIEEDFLKTKSGQFFTYSRDEEFYSLDLPK